MATGEHKAVRARGLGPAPKFGPRNPPRPEALSISSAPAARPWALTGSLAVDVLVGWAFVAQRAGSAPTAGLLRAEAEASGLTWYGSSTDGCAAIERIGAVGCRIDVSGPNNGKVSDVADAVVRSVDDAAKRGDVGAVLVQVCGRGGAAPSGWRVPDHWALPALGWEPSPDSYRKRAVWVMPDDALGRPYLTREGVFTPVVIASMEDVEAARATYRAWWDALDDLAWVLTAQALGFAVTPPSVAREPWLEPMLPGFEKVLDGGFNV